MNTNQEKVIEFIKYLRDRSIEYSMSFSSKQLDESIHPLKSCNRMELQKLAGFCLDVVDGMKIASDKNTLKDRAEKFAAIQSQVEGGLSPEMAMQVFEFSQRKHDFEDSIRRLLTTFVGLDAESQTHAKDIILKMFLVIFSNTLSKTCDDLIENIQSLETTNRLHSD